jgi:molecular chaperone GrpE
MADPLDFQPIPDLPPDESDGGPGEGDADAAEASLDADFAESVAEALGEDALAQAEAIVDGAEREMSLEALVAERTEDLQRLQAEYVNYKRRVDRDKVAARQQGAASVVRELVPVFDAVQTAEQQENLPDGVKLAFAELARIAVKLGLETFGAVGDEFDPTTHEALYQLPTADVPPMSVAAVVQPGYRLHDQVLRPARVAVAVEPTE